MSPEEITRRKTLIGTATALAGVTVVGTASAKNDELSAELNSVRSATKRYRDVSLAREDGYVVESAYVPEMGFHLINPDLLAPDAEAAVEITEPPILVYFTTGDYRPEPGAEHDGGRDGDLRLGAVEYGHLGDVDALAGQDPPANPVEGTPANYFSDEDAKRTLKVSEEEGWQWTPGPDITALHVWVHRGNPAGVFNPTNTTIN